MNSRRPQGFAVTELVIVLVIIAVICTVGYLVLGRGKLSGEKTLPTASTAGQAAATGKLPVLQSLAGISFGPYNAADGTSGDFVFPPSAANQPSKPTDLLLVPFAQEICGDTADAASCKTGTELSMNGLKLDTAVKAAAAGKIVNLQTSDGESSFTTVSSDYPGYSIGYNHVYQPTIKEGQVITAGQVLGTAAPYGDKAFGRVGLFITKTNAAGQTGINNVCPLDYLDAKAEATITPSLKQFMQDWNSFVGSEAYKLQDMRRAGCVASHTTE